MPRARDRYSSVATPHKHTPVKVPLNDDKKEKAKRLQSRQALHESQMSQIRAAATPQRRRQTLTGADANTSFDDDSAVQVGGSVVTPMKRVPILANFEEWMKMATDNKINATNSWNFALIDYFHDMSLLKEGDGVNFQRASCTLDGCVKIYTSRVDSVATETGKLLTGLATSSDSKKRKGDGADGDGDGDDDDDEGEDGQRKKPRRRAQRSAESTLVSSFAQLQLKKMELEFSVDPLFKKASADFDEGGAKGLLLNHLAIDGNGRIVFDSSDDVKDAAADEELEDPMDIDGEEKQPEAQEQAQEADIDISALGAKFFPDLSILDAQDICPSLKDFDLGDPNGAANLPYLKAPDDWRNENKDSEETGDAVGGFMADGFDDDDDDGGLGAFDLPADTGFGEGGEVWAKEAALETQMRVHTMDVDMGGDGDNEDGMGEVGGFDAERSHYGVTLTAGREQDQENILNYFDQALQKNWAGPEHWRIRRIKDISKANAAGPTKRKEKEPFEIDFGAPMTQLMADALYVSAASSTSICLPKTQWKSKTRNLLPDDKHFNSRQLLRLFLKPKARTGARNKSGPGGSRPDNENRRQQEPEGEMDEVFWARNEDATVQPAIGDEDGAPQGDYDADFFQDDGIGGAGLDDEDDIFADAREMFSPHPEGEEGTQRGLNGLLNMNQEGAFGTQLVTQSRRLRPEYVQYARVAKKVDVRRLKEEMWRGIGLGEEGDSTLPLQDLSASTNKFPAAQPLSKAADGSLKFTAVVNNLQSVYPKKAMADISTSYCFICLLHLANEKGLVIENEKDFTDLTIRKDPRAEAVDGE